MPRPPDAVVEHYDAQQRQAVAAEVLVLRLWRRMALEDLEGSWAAIVRRVTVTVASAQLGAARAGAAYVPLALGEDAVDPDGQVNPARFAGIAADGRRLDALLYSGVVRTKLSLGRGRAAADALADGGQWLATVSRTQVADAARGAAGVAIAARARVGWVRMVSPPCCQRCAVLAGKRFRWNDGFRRHPKCDCRHIPVSEGAAPDYTDQVDPSQIRDLTRAQRQAVADGGDLNQVVNARRGRSRDGMTTSEGSTLRRGRAQRLTPEGIYRLSSSRDEALRRLRDNGYLL